VILEVNTIPGLTETSLLPKAAGIMGIGFNELCLKLIDLAYEKTKTA
jgi:D-alanine-D-alanine ligase